MNRKLTFALSLLLAVSVAQAQVSDTRLIRPASGGGGASVAGNNAWTGTNSFIDGNFSIVGSVDATKIAKVEVDGFTAGNTRIFTFPGATGNDTFALAGTANTFTAQNNFSSTSAQIISGNAGGLVAAGSSTANDAIRYLTALTPDGFPYLTGSTANSFRMYEHADLGFDYQNGPCGSAACTNPQQTVFDKDQNTTNYQAQSISGLSGKFVVTLAEATPTSVVIIPVVAASSVSGQLLYTVHARDGTNSQTRSGRVIYSGVAEGVTATCVIGTPEELDNTPTGTLTATITCTSPANNQIQLLISATSSLTQTTLEAYGTLIHVGAGEPLPQ